MKGSSRRSIRAVFLAGIAAGGALLLLFIHLPFSPEEIETWDSSPVLLDRRGEPFFAALSESSEWSIPIPLSEMGKWIPLAAVEVEDRRFRDHEGVDLISVFRAILQNIRSGRVVSGASTITSQLIRLSHPRPRTVQTKLLNSRSRSERTGLSKDISNCSEPAPFGGNIRGVEAAARCIFHKILRRNCPAEAACCMGDAGPSCTCGQKSRHPERRTSSFLLGRGKHIRRTVPLALSELFRRKEEAFPSKPAFRPGSLGDGRQEAVLRLDTGAGTP